MLLIILAAAWIAGLLPVGLWGAPWWLGAAWVGAPAAALAAWRRISLPAAAAGVVLAAAAGARLAGALQPEVIPVSEFTGEEATIFGTVVSEPDPRDLTTAYDIRVDRLVLEDRTTIEHAGTVRAWLHQYANYLPGDRVRLEGELEAAPVFDDFDYRSYLARRGVGAVMYRPKDTLEAAGQRSLSRELARARLALDRSLQRALPEPEASLGAGIAFGRDGGLPRDVVEAFNRSGLRHLVAVSGANLVLVAALTMAASVRLVGRRRGWPLAAGAVAAYVAVAGFEPSVVRAAVMTAVLFAGELVGRPQSGMPGLAAAIIVITAGWPRLAVDPGFQLSAAATAGLIAFGPWLRHGAESARRWWPVSWLPGWLTDVAALSLAATLATTPITWAHFGSVSLIGPLANVLVQPVVAVAFWASLATALAAAAAVAYYPLAFILDTAQLAASPGWAAIESGRLSPEVAALALSVLAAVGHFAYRYLPDTRELPEAVRGRAVLGNRLLVGGATGALVLAIAPGIDGRPGHLRIDMLDVGQGDAILLTTPRGAQILVDTGPSGLRLARQLGAVMPHWDRTIELVLVSHPQEDHIGGLPALASRYRVRTVVTTGDRNDTRTAALAAAAVEERESVARAGDHFTVDGVHFTVLWPKEGTGGSLNDRSLVVLVEYDGVRLLLTGDSETPAQRALLAAGLEQVDILKVPHHGSRTSDPSFLALANGGLALISVGAGNPFGHPHPNTLAALEGATVVRTDADGRIRVDVESGRIRVRTER